MQAIMRYFQKSLRGVPDGKKCFLRTFTSTLRHFLPLWWSIQELIKKISLILFHRKLLVSYSRFLNDCLCLELRYSQSPTKLYVVSIAYIFIYTQRAINARTSKIRLINTTDGHAFCSFYVGYDQLQRCSNFKF